MLILIIGPQNSGKTETAKEIHKEMICSNMQIPTVYDNGEFTYEKPSTELLKKLFLKDIVGAISIITIQFPGYEKSPVMVPHWVADAGLNYKVITTTQPYIQA